MLAGPPFNYLETLDKVDECIKANADFAETIAQIGLQSMQLGETGPDQEIALPREWTGCAKHQDVDKARSTLRQFYRDWSEEGAEERAACYNPVKNALKKERAKRQERGVEGRMKILVPGAGLARLMFDLCVDGFDVEGNEISYHQLLASSYVLNFCEHVGQHTIYPWVHGFSNHKTRSNHLRGYKIPDIHCATVMGQAPEVGTMSMTAADFICDYSNEEKLGTFDAVASCFFLDTAPNLIRYLQTIHGCLKPGGLLVNIGPLLWHFENTPPGQHHHEDDDGDQGNSNNRGNGIADPGSFELTDDEVMALVEKMGFVVESRTTGIHAPYIQDPESMLQTTYRASSWVARKPT